MFVFIGLGSLSNTLLEDPTRDSSENNCLNKKGHATNILSHRHVSKTLVTGFTTV